jgi:hypothetical protein
VANRKEVSFLNSMEVFGVQRISRNGNQAADECLTVHAQCAVKAGELVLAEPLSLHGQVVKAEVWCLKDDFTPHFVDLYALQP